MHWASGIPHALRARRILHNPGASAAGSRMHMLATLLRFGLMSSGKPASRRTEPKMGASPSRVVASQASSGLGRWYCGVPGMFPSRWIPAYKSGLLGAGPEPHALCRNRPKDTIVYAVDRSIDLWQFPAAAGGHHGDQHGQRHRHQAHRFDLCRAAAAAERRRSGRGDRPAHERAAARGPRFRDRSGRPLRSGRRGRLGIGRAAEEDAARACARAAGDDRRRHAAAGELPRGHRTRHRIDCTPRRTDCGIAVGPRTV